MNVEPRLELDRWVTRRLGAADEPALQDLLERCPDHFQLHERRPAEPDAAQSELTDLPPGRTQADKHVHGIADPLDPERLIGVIESVSGYPDPTTWYLGLLLIDPSRRGDGLGRDAVTAFEHMVAAAGFDRIRLAVIEPNVGGRRFWGRHGYRLVATRDDHTLGSVAHRTHVLEKSLRPVEPEHASGERTVEELDDP